MRTVFEHRVYESVQTPNVGYEPGASPLYWARVGPTNRWHMFDGEVGTQSAVDGRLEVTVKSGLINSLALLELEGAHIEVTVRDGLDGPVVYARDQTLELSVVGDWYEYFFGPFAQRKEVILADLPTYGTAHVTVTITGVGEVKCGEMVVGTAKFVGDMEHGASAGIIDYSRKDTSATGQTTFVKRRYSKRLSARLLIENGALDRVQRLLADLRATPCVWIGTEVDGYGPLSVFGFYRDFALDVAYPTVSYCSLEIEGLV